MHLIFVRHKHPHWLGVAARWLGRGPWEHVAVVYASTVYSKRPDGTMRSVPLNQYLAEVGNVSCIEIPYGDERRLPPELWPPCISHARRACARNGVRLPYRIFTPTGVLNYLRRRGFAYSELQWSDPEGAAQEPDGR